MDAQIRGRTIESVLRVPRRAVRDGNTVWIVSSEQKLEKREIEPVWEDATSLWVREGLESGAALVTSPLGAPVQGTTVRIMQGER